MVENTTNNQNVNNNETMDPNTLKQQTEFKVNLAESFSQLNVGALEQVYNIANKLEEIMNEPKSWKWKKETWKEGLGALKEISKTVLDNTKFFEEQITEIKNDLEQIKKLVNANPTTETKIEEVDKKENTEE